MYMQHKGWEWVRIESRPFLRNTFHASPFTYAVLGRTKTSHFQRRFWCVCARHVQIPDCTWAWHLEPLVMSQLRHFQWFQNMFSEKSIRIGLNSPSQHGHGPRQYWAVQYRTVGIPEIIHHKGPKLRACLVSSWFSLGFPTLATSQFGGRGSLRNDMATGWIRVTGKCHCNIL